MALIIFNDYILLVYVIGSIHPQDVELQENRHFVLSSCPRLSLPTDNSLQHKANTQKIFDGLQLVLGSAISSVHPHGDHVLSLGVTRLGGKPRGNLGSL